jgi:hypothetical protein
MRAVHALKRVDLFDERQEGRHPSRQHCIA